MKVKDILNRNQNKNNNQIVLTLRRNQLKKLGIAPDDFMNMRINKTKRKIKWS